MTTASTRACHPRRTEVPIVGLDIMNLLANVEITGSKVIVYAVVLDKHRNKTPPKKVIIRGKIWSI